MLSLSGLSHGVVRVDKEGSLTSLTLQDCGTVLPGGMPYCSHVVMFDPCLLCKPIWKMGICWAFLSHLLNAKTFKFNYENIKKTTAQLAFKMLLKLHLKAYSLNYLLREQGMAQ